MSTVLQLHRPEDADEMAGALLHACGARRLFTFSGPLGAGKTTLIKALCAELGVEAGTGSPSFSIVNEYADTNGDPVYHIDLYRLKDVKELEGIGFDEYVDSGHYCFVEWPEMARAQLPYDVVKVSIEVGETGTRTISLTP